MTIERKPLSSMLTRRLFLRKANRDVPEEFDACVNNYLLLVDVDTQEIVAQVLYDELFLFDRHFNRFVDDV